MRKQHLTLTNTNCKCTGSKKRLSAVSWKQTRSNLLAGGGDGGGECGGSKLKKATGGAACSIENSCKSRAG